MHAVALVRIRGIEALDDSRASIDEIMTEYDENLEVDSYPSQYYTPDRIISEIESLFDNEHPLIYDQPETYLIKYSNENIRSLFKKVLKDAEEHDAFYAMKENRGELNEHFISDCCSQCIEEDGLIYTTQNPKGKFDWYEVGGRWQGMLKLKKGRKGLSCDDPNILSQNAMETEKHADVAYSGNIDWESIEMKRINVATIIDDGNWIDKEDMCAELPYWGALLNDTEKKELAYREYMKKFVGQLKDDDVIVIVDYHY